VFGGATSWEKKSGVQIYQRFRRGGREGRGFEENVKGPEKRCGLKDLRDVRNRASQKTKGGEKTGGEEKGVGDQLGICEGKAWRKK